MNLEFGLGLTQYFLFGVYLAGFVALLLTLVWRVEVGIVYLTLLLPQQNLIDRLAMYPAGTQVLHLFMVAITLKWIMACKANKEPIFAKAKANWPLMAFIAFTYFQVWWGTIYSGAAPPLSFL